MRRFCIDRKSRADPLPTSFGGREKSLEAQAKAGLSEVKKEGQEVLADTKQLVKDAKDKITK